MDNLATPTIHNETNITHNNNSNNSNNNITQAGGAKGHFRFPIIYK